MFALTSNSFAYNTLNNKTTKFSTFVLVFGKQPKLPIDLFVTGLSNISGDDRIEYIKELNKRFKLMLQLD